MSEGLKKKAKEAETDHHLLICSFIQQITIEHFLCTRHYFSHWSHIQGAGNVLSLELFQNKSMSDSNKYSEEGDVVELGLDGHFSKVGQLLEELRAELQDSASYMKDQVKSIPGGRNS